VSRFIQTKNYRIDKIAVIQTLGVGIVIGWLLVKAVLWIL